MDAYRNAYARAGALLLGAAAVFGAALGAGALVGPVGTAAAEAPAMEHVDQHPGTSTAGTPGGADRTADAAPEPPGGLMTAQDGYALALAERQLSAGDATPVSFRVLGPDGAPVTAYDESHDERLHLIAVRRDLTGFQHVHPELGADGTWTVPLALTAGDWRLYADFVPTGHDGLALGTDLAVAGEYAPRPVPAPSRTVEVDGYTVTLDGDLAAGRETELVLTVSRDGAPVTDLQPYLGAFGHLVVLRDGDLAYLHVHPAGHPGDGRTPPGPEVRFATTAPSAGTYRLFLDFRHGSVVRTAEFTVLVGEGGPAPAEPAIAHAHADGAGHD